MNSIWLWTHLVRPKNVQWSYQIFHLPCQFLSWNTKRPIDYFQHRTARTTTSYRSLEESSRKLCGLRRNLLQDRFFCLILIHSQFCHYHLLPELLTMAELKMNSLVLGLRFRECSLQQNVIKYHGLWTFCTCDTLKRTQFFIFHDNFWVGIPKDPSTIFSIEPH